ncbi:MAG: response regulator [Methylococcales bacterium]|nr:response regulator [Methylococcales bacterium]
MELNDLPQERQHSAKIRVAPLGFEADVVEKLEKIFQRDRSEQRAYTTIYPCTDESVDILLVNYDNPTALSEKNTILTQYPDVHLVAASQGALLDESIIYSIHPYQVHGILLAARLLSTLDKVPDGSLPEHQSQTATPVPEATDSASADIAQSYSVLVVDDSVSIQKSLEINLLTLQHIDHIDFADSGEMALEKIEAKQYDIIFLDVMMPGIDGYETCTRIRQMPLYKKTPIVMVSAKCSPLDEVKGIVAGCTTYLTKPVQNEAFQKLSHRMMEWLANKKTPQQ